MFYCAVTVSRLQDAEMLKEELKQARLAEKIAKDRLLEVSGGSVVYPVSFCTVTLVMQFT